MRVVQIEPGPMPTLTPSAPASMSAFAASAVTMLPAMSCRLGYARFDEQLDALIGVGARADGSADAQRAALVFARVRIVVRFLDVLHGDHAAKLEALVLVDDEHLLDAVLVQEPEHRVFVRAFAHGD